MKSTLKIIAALLIATLMLCLCACGGVEQTSNTSETTDQTTPVEESKKSPDLTAQYLEYAKQLEEAGNSEAAAAVYAMIDKAVDADANIMAEHEASEDVGYQLYKKTETLRSWLEYGKKVTDR